MHNARHLPLKLHNSDEVYLGNNKSGKHDANVQSCTKAGVLAFKHVRLHQAVYVPLFGSHHMQTLHQNQLQMLLWLPSPRPLLHLKAARTEESSTMLLGLVKS